jgi:hypothetical protein
MSHEPTDIQLEVLQLLIDEPGIAPRYLAGRLNRDVDAVVQIFQSLVADGLITLKKQRAVRIDDLPIGVVGVWREIGLKQEQERHIMPCVIWREYSIYFNFDAVSRFLIEQDDE